MSGNPLKIVIITSTSGSVMNALLENTFFQSQIFSVVSDRDCIAIDRAQSKNVPIKIIPEMDKLRFCDSLLTYLSIHRIDYVISFFTKLFVGELLNAFKDRILNLHPSLLPAFKGMNGFGDSYGYGGRYLGTTIHFIDKQMDQGKIIMQTIYPFDQMMSQKKLRHRVYQQQCKSLLQTVKWLAQDRIIVRDSRVQVLGSTYIDYEFSPNLDYSEAITLSV